MHFVQLKKEIEFEFSDDKDLLKKLQELYTLDGFTPVISIDGDFIHIEVNEKAFLSSKEQFNKANNLCNHQQFSEAIELFKKVVEVCPFHLDAYRNMAQAYMMLGDLDKAIDYNIEALRLDATNVWGLILMGNILMRKNDKDTALTYYNRVLEYHPDDVLALNNLGCVYAGMNDFDKAFQLFEKGLSIDDTYSSLWYSYAASLFNSNKYKKAFDIALKAMPKIKERPENGEIKPQLLQIAISSAEKLCDHDVDLVVAMNYAKKLEEQYNTEIKMVKDESMSLAGQIKYGPTYGLPYHTLVYNPKHPYVAHLFLHELKHLDMSLAASQKGTFKKCFAPADSLSKFKVKIAPTLKNLQKSMDPASLEQFVRQMMNGMGLQLMNCPLDLLVEDRIYNEHPELRHVQFLSLLKLDKEGLESVQTGIKYPSHYPPMVVKANKVMNIVTTKHLTKLFGVDFKHKFGGNKSEIETANDLYEEYEDYATNGYEPGEEFNLMKYFIDTFDGNDIIKQMPV